MVFYLIETEPGFTGYQSVSSATVHGKSTVVHMVHMMRLEATTAVGGSHEFLRLLALHLHISRYPPEILW
jgi:hypothetical protein